MADTGYNWGTAAHITYSTGSDIDGIAVADEGTLTSDAVSLDGKAACEVSVVTYEDNTGACDGNVNVYVLGTDNDPDSEGWQDSADPGVMAYAIDQAQNATERLVFSIDPQQVSRFKIYVYNQAGQGIALTVNYNTATIPVAS
jgi:hypothetical protein